MKYVSHKSMLYKGWIWTTVYENMGILNRHISVFKVTCTKLEYYRYILNRIGMTNNEVDNI